MAKANNPQGLSGTIKGLTYVKSKKYGDHVRNPRGTFKPAVLNEAMEHSKNNLLHVNVIASLLFSGIRDEHRDGTLWPRMLSALRCQLKEKDHADVFGLLNLECHAVHTLHELLRGKWDTEVLGIIKRRLHITLGLSGAPRWKTKNMVHFQASLHVLFPYPVRNRLKKEVVYSEVLPLLNYPEKIPFVIPIPSGATSYAVFLKVTGCIDGVPKNGLQSTGMCCVVVGNIPGKENKPAESKAAPKKKQAVARGSNTGKKQIAKKAQ